MLDGRFGLRLSNLIIHPVGAVVLLPCPARDEVGFLGGSMCGCVEFVMCFPREK